MKVFEEHFLDIISWIFGLLLIIYSPSSDGVVFLDVGQGDSILIQKGNFQILIDGGADNSALYQLPQYMPYGDMKIDLVVLTHPHDDHMFGLFEIFDRYEIGKVLYNSVDYKSEIYEYFLSLDINNNEAEEGYMYLIGTWRFQILYSSDYVYEETKNINNSSIVAELTTDNKSFLFMGDAEAEEEEYLIKMGILDQVDVLKAGHHCSKTASSEAFLNTVKPKIAVCSYGESNKYGHPHAETIQRFRDMNMVILSTEKEGNIYIL